MAILSYHGCPPNVPCMGPPQQWWLFGIPVSEYPWLLVASLVPGLIAFIIILTIGRKKSVAWRRPVLTSVILYVASFLLLIILRAWIESNTFY